MILGEAAALGSFSSGFVPWTRGDFLRLWIGWGNNQDEFFWKPRVVGLGDVLVVESKKHLLVALRSDFMENKTQELFFPQLRVSMQWMHLQPGMLDLLPRGLEHFLYLWNKVKSVL